MTEDTSGSAESMTGPLGGHHPAAIQRIDYLKVCNSGTIAIPNSFLFYKGAQYNFVPQSQTIFQQTAVLVKKRKGLILSCQTS